MKKFINISIFTLFCICLTSILTACQEEEFGFTQQEISYESAFVKEYGRPVEGSTFGFVDQPIAKWESATRSAWPNANQWGEKLSVPEPLTEQQKTAVTNWFASHRSPQGVAVSWSDYFAQQVSSTSYGANMDYVLDAGHGYTDHIYNANSGDISENGSVTYVQNGPQHSDKIQYMYNQSTASFAYHESVSDKTWYDHYVIIPGETIDPTNQYGLAGMYFLGFDYESYKFEGSSNNVARDFYYNDWIIKITPGLRKGYPAVVRVMCEDLGDSFDWDWNDVVFDVSFEVSNSQEQSRNIVEAIITVQCAGGTLPIYIGQTTEEVHSLWGKPSSEVILHPSAPVIYRVDVTDMPGVIAYGSNYANARNIPVYVKSESASNTIQANKIPQKFACPNTVAWSEELVNICETYPEFPTWITDDQSVKDAWEKVWGLDPKNDISNGINTGETNHEQVLTPVPEPEITPEPTPEPEPEPTPEPTPEPEDNGNTNGTVDGGSNVVTDSGIPANAVSLWSGSITNTTWSDVICESLPYSQVYIKFEGNSSTAVKLISSWNQQAAEFDVSSGNVASSRVDNKDGQSGYRITVPAGVTITAIYGAE